MKCNQSRPGFELVSPCPFPTTITITPRAPQIKRLLCPARNEGQVEYKKWEGQGNYESLLLPGMGEKYKWKYVGVERMNPALWLPKIRYWRWPLIKGLLWLVNVISFNPSRLYHITFWGVFWYYGQILILCTIPSVSLFLTNHALFCTSLT